MLPNDEELEELEYESNSIKRDILGYKEKNALLPNQETFYTTNNDFY